MQKDDVFLKGASAYGTPYYLFDLDEWSECVKKTTEMLGGALHLCYAMKANPFLVSFLPGDGCMIEACSMGEYAICRAQKVAADRLVVSGVLKKQEDMEKIVREEDILPVFTVESVTQFEMFGRIAEKSGRRLRLLLRLSSQNQFGMSSAQIEKTISESQRIPLIQIIGLHYFSGTQKSNMERVVHELFYLDDICVKLEEKFGISFECLEYGPGMYVEYFQEQNEWNPENALRKISSCVESMRFKGRVTLEMGRFLAAACGYYITAVQEVKLGERERYVLVDGGIHHMHYEGQMLAMKIPYFRQLPFKVEQWRERFNVCGALCTSNDMLARQVPLNEPHQGDLLVFERVGAYSMTEGMSLFLSRDLPAVIAWQEKSGFTLLRAAEPVYPLNMASCREKREG